MSVHWSVERARELAERRKKQNKCVRCELYYYKTENKCPHCSDIPDYKIKSIIAKRKKERTTIGKYMLLAMVTIIFAMYYAIS